MTEYGQREKDTAKPAFIPNAAGFVRVEEYIIESLSLAVSGEHARPHAGIEQSTRPECNAG